MVTSHGEPSKRRDKVLLRVVAVDAGRVLEVGRVRVLVAVAEAHQGLVGPGVFHHHGHVNDPRLELETLDVSGFGVYLFEA